MSDRARSAAVLSLAITAALMLSPQSVAGAIWSNTEFQIQYGDLETPEFFPGAPTGTKTTTIFTFQHASGWKHGENFFFFDVISSDSGGFGDTDTYGEWYSYFSFRKEPMGGMLKDVRFVAGFNWAPDADSVKYLPGVNLSWNCPGFAFLNTDLTLYLDDSVGIANGGSAPSEGDSWMLDFSWKRPFKNGKFSIEGHAEYIDGRDNEFGDRVEGWILAQPQFRFYATPSLALGIEYQYWQNKLGTPTDENAIQALLVWVF
ncbi:MAG: hypothetical protein OES32_10880 [Acidobacteriota bacterium]|nr:hypothetical protein [Acidobacteriota bacterium]MDH3524080.1 hypothetical protein [Acidobacteriota bacterium]